VLTNEHVVSARGEDELRFMVLVDDGRGGSVEHASTVVARGSVPDCDLAVLRIEGVALPPAQLATDSDLGVGEDVFVVAAPYGRALSVSAGLVSQIDFDKEAKPSMLKTDAAIGYGASGGGMFSAVNGRLLGIVEGYRTAKVSIPVAQETYSFDIPMPGETFVAPVAKIRAFLTAEGLGGLLEAEEKLGTASSEATDAFQGS